MISIVPPAHRSDIKVIGGTACLLHGSDRSTEGVDFAISSKEAFDAIDQAINGHQRFQGVIEDGSAEYTSVSGINVKIGLSLSYVR